MAIVMNDAVLELIEAGLKKLVDDGLLDCGESNIKDIAKEYFGIVKIDIVLVAKGVEPKASEPKDKKTRVRKDSGPRPKRGKSAWDIYLAEKRGEFKEYLSDEENKDELEELECRSLSAAILKYAGKKWKEVTDKSYYEAESAKSKEAVAAENLAAGFSPKKGKKSPKSEETVAKTPSPVKTSSPKKITPKKLIEFEEEEQETVEAIEVVVDKTTYYYDEQSKKFYNEDSDEIADKKLLTKLKKAVKELKQ